MNYHLQPNLMTHIGLTFSLMIPLAVAIKVKPSGKTLFPTTLITFLFIFSQYFITNYIGVRCENRTKRAILGTIVMFLLTWAAITLFVSYLHPLQDEEDEKDKNNV